MRNASGWKGQLGMVMGGLLYIDMSDSLQVEAKIDELYNVIVSKIKTPLLVLLEKQRLALATVSSSSPSPSSPSPVVAAVVASPVAAGVNVTGVLLDQQAKCEEAMLQWLLAYTPGRFVGVIDSHSSRPTPYNAARKTSMISQSFPFSNPAIFSSIPPPHPPFQVSTLPHLSRTPSVSTPPK